MYACTRTCAQQSYSSVWVVCNKLIIIISELSASQQNQFAWHPSGEIHMTVGGQGSVSMDTRNHTTEDVEVMSTDSSSSSSSDSQ